MRRPSPTSTRPREHPPLQLVALKPARPPLPVTPPAATPVTVDSPPHQEASSRLSPQTIADLQLLNLRPTLPKRCSDLRSAVAWCMADREWTWEHTHAYRRLWALLGGPAVAQSAKTGG